MIQQFLQLGGVRTEKEFYEKFRNPEDFDNYITMMYGGINAYAPGGQTGEGGNPSTWWQQGPPQTNLFPRPGMTNPQQVAAPPQQVSRPRGSSDPNSLVDYLNKTQPGQNYNTVASRRKLAEQYGIDNYTGGYDQNRELMRKIKASSSTAGPNTLRVQNPNPQRTQQPTRPQAGGKQQMPPTTSKKSGSWISPAVGMGAVGVGTAGVIGAGGRNIMNNARAGKFGFTGSPQTSMYQAMYNLNEKLYGAGLKDAKLAAKEWRNMTPVEKGIYRQVSKIQAGEEALEKAKKTMLRKGIYKDILKEANTKVPVAPPPSPGRSAWQAFREAPYIRKGLQYIRPILKSKQDGGPIDDYDMQTMQTGGGVNFSIVDYLKSIGYSDTSYKGRKKLAEMLNVKNYKGTAKQNLEIMARIQQDPELTNYYGNRASAYTVDQQYPQPGMQQNYMPPAGAPYIKVPSAYDQGLPIPSDYNVDDYNTGSFYSSGYPDDYTTGPSVPSAYRQSPGRGYANGGAYSGTYDAGSGSYFPFGGAYMPQDFDYSRGLPQFQQGAMYANGGLVRGSVHDISEEDVQDLINRGYKLKYL